MVSIKFSQSKKWFQFRGTHLVVSQSKNGKPHIFQKNGFSFKKWFPFRGSQSFYGTHLVVSISWFSIILWYSSRGFHHIYKNIMIYMFFQTYESLVRLNFYVTSCHSCGSVVKNVYCSIQNSKTKQMYTAVYKIRRLSKCILQYTFFGGTYMVRLTSTNIIIQ